MSEREQPEVDPAEMGNYEGVSGGEYTSQSGDPEAEAAQEAQAGAGDEDPEGE
jgi:hypothetical protein